MIRDVLDDVLAALDVRAKQLGLSRTQYLRRRLAQDAAASSSPVTAHHLRSFGGNLRGPGRRRRDGVGLGVTTAWLVDKSALVRLGSSPDAEEWASRLEHGLVHIATLTASRSASRPVRVLMHLRRFAARR